MTIGDKLYLFSVLSGFLGLLLGYFLKAFLDKKNELEARKFDRKEEQYKKFLELALKGFCEGWIEKGKDREFLLELNTNALLYASDNVIEAAYKFQYCFDKGKEKSFPRGESDKYLKELIMMIRKELIKMQGDKTKIKSESLDIRKII